MVGVVASQVKQKNGKLGDGDWEAVFQGKGLWEAVFQEKGIGSQLSEKPPPRRQLSEIPPQSHRLGGNNSHACRHRNCKKL